MKKCNVYELVFNFSTVELSFEDFSDKEEEIVGTAGVSDKRLLVVSETIDLAVSDWGRLKEGIKSVRLLGYTYLD